ncbi:MAG: FG-GAP-like repeat-containing protein [Acidobacteriota bacterium]|nr:FG-GAP-like repeat-containing protein [Blastocatellia bacterium]MDW8412799.1 FG-GAP-like repeat-containing protein [Acidobacteriota bacterium]
MLIVAALLILPSISLDKEIVYRHNNLGVALMEEFKHEAAAVEFKKALELDPQFLPARINLALAHYHAHDTQAAIEQARHVLKIDPQNPHMHYLLGLIYRAANKTDEAIAEMQQVAALDPNDVGTNVNLGMLYNQKQDYAKAIEYLRKAIVLEPYNATANYLLAIALLRSGNRAEGQSAMEKFQKLRSSSYATTFGQLYFEQGRYSECIEIKGNEPMLVSAAAKISFTAEKVFPTDDNMFSPPATLSKEEIGAVKSRLIASFAAGPYPFDYDADSDLDLLVISKQVSLYRNDVGKFADVSKLLPKLEGLFSGAVAADYDNDHRQDLLLFGYKTLRLLKNTPDGFRDFTDRLPLRPSAWTLSAAFVDLDHDGDVDIYLGNFIDLDAWPQDREVLRFPDDFPGQPNQVFRNNGDGTFTDITQASGLSGNTSRTVAVVAVDFDNKRDVDLLVINYGSAVQLFRNERSGSFKDVAKEVGINFSGATYGIAAGDINKDDYVDFVIPDLRAEALLFLSTGQGSFKQSILPAWSKNASTAQTLDYDNDGLLDLIVSREQQLQIARNLGTEFSNVDVGKIRSQARTFAVFDVNNDGGLDLLTMAEGIISYKAETSSNWFKVLLRGRVSNRSGIGARVELRSGSLKQRLECFAVSPPPSAAELHFGLGNRTQIDAIKVIWPAGIVQPERSISFKQSFIVEELDRKGTSCPLLYAWNGSKYEFITDFLGGCAIGYLLAPGQYNYPDTDEYVLVKGESLKPANNRYKISLNNQLEEVIFFDEVKLLAVDHPEGSEVYPNERLMPAPPYPEFKVYGVKNPRPPLSAKGNFGQDVLELLLREDRTYVEDFRLLPFKGYAELHTLTLELERSDTSRLLLLLTGWIDYADSTSNLAASQAGLKLRPPYLEALNEDGQWQTIVDSIGFPAGLTKTIVVDLSGKLPPKTKLIRIVTSMRIYWDKVAIDYGEAVAVTITQLAPVKAVLARHGFPREFLPAGRPPVAYEYEKTGDDAPWKVHEGNYTRYGDVRELLLELDDMYVITRSGDKIELEFDAALLPPLPAGWQRDFLVYADGFGKDMDINSASPDTVEPLPFHRMSSYPYPEGEEYPQTENYRRYHEQYNSRVFRRKK